jgi:ribonuclease-3
VLDSGGSSHDPWFLVGVEVGGTTLGQGRGKSKRLAERAAAAAALQALDAASGSDAPEQEAEHAT